MGNVCVEYVVTFLNIDTNKIKTDCFMGESQGEAVYSFKECYRHGNYKVLSVAKTGREIGE